MQEQNHPTQDVIDISENVLNYAEARDKLTAEQSKEPEARGQETNIDPAAELPPPPAGEDLSSTGSIAEAEAASAREGVGPTEVEQLKAERDQLAGPPGAPAG